MMLLQYAAPGFVIPTLSHYLKNFLIFEPKEVGWVMAMPALFGILGQLALSRLVDRKISAERLLSLCHAMSGVLMFLLYTQHEFVPFLCIYALYGFFFVPTFGLTNTIAFHHLNDARDFGRVRMWGPVSWVVVGWAFGFLWLRAGDAELTAARVPQALLFSAITSVSIVVFALGLPRNRRETPGVVMAPRSLRTLFLRRDMRVLCVLALLTTITHQFYYYGMAPYLSQIGLPDAYMLPVLSLGQCGEVLVLALLGKMIARTGFTMALTIGLAAQLFRFGAFASGSLCLSVLAIPLHGLCYACFFSVAYIYLDTHCEPGNRGGAQQLFNILIVGLGNLLGSILAGEVASRLPLPEGGIDYGAFWWITAGASAALLAMLALLFREEPGRSIEQGGYQSGRG